MDHYKSTNYGSYAVPCKADPSKVENTVNAGSAASYRSVRQAHAWLEYCNGVTPTKWNGQRANNGQANDRMP